MSQANLGPCNFDLLDKLISIARNGELRDVEFIENIFNTKFSIRREDLVIDPTNKPYIRRFILKPESNLFGNADFEYSIETELLLPFVPAYEMVIAGITIAYADRALCVTPDLIRSRIGEKEDFIMHGSTPPLSQMYVFTLSKTDMYHTDFTILEPDSQIKCSRIIQITQYKNKLREK